MGLIFFLFLSFFYGSIGFYSHLTIMILNLVSSNSGLAKPLEILKNDKKIPFKKIYFKIFKPFKIEYRQNLFYFLVIFDKYFNQSLVILVSLNSFSMVVERREFMLISKVWN